MGIGTGVRGMGELTPAGANQLGTRTCAMPRHAFTPATRPAGLCWRCCGWAESHAVEWARNHINVNRIAPGAFSSEMMDGMLSRVGDISQGFPRKRICDPAQMDSTLLFLVSPASECVTGTVIKIDDGQGPR